MIIEKFVLPIQLKPCIVIIVLLNLVFSSCNQKKSDSREAQTEHDEARTPMDKEITNAIQLEFQLQPGIDAENINVNTRDGIVMLTGVENNILAKDRATNIAEVIKGVRGVVNDIEIKATGLTDEQIRENVRSILFSDPAASIFNIDVAVNDGEVTLTGTVETWQEKMLVENVAKGAIGVRDLHNKLDLKFEAERTDMEMERAIKRVNNWDVRVDDGLLDVKVEDGKAYLSGVVGSVAEKNEAIANAWVEGIRIVNTDDLRVERWARDEELRKNKYGPDKSDEEMAEAITDAFIYDPRINPFNVQATVDRGKVTLTGIVDNLKAKNAAEKTARNVVGVYEVNNLLKVENGAPISDQKLAQGIRDAIALDPYVENYEIMVEVDDGKAVLSGVVDNYFEKYKAYDDATGVKVFLK